MCKSGFKNYIDLILKNNIFDADCIQNDWFPRINADIFISHSHNDYMLATALAGWLFEDFNLKVFIDSNVWGNANDLLEQINSKFSDKRIHGSGFLYNHEKCNRASQHVYIMLLMALQKLIDNVESVFFLNTGNSVNAVSNNQISSTYSPWIYAEILCTEIIRKKNIEEYRNGRYITEGSPLFHFQTPDYNVNYNLNLDNLIDVNECDLCNWRNMYIETKQKPENALDCLYELISLGG